jgi:2-iminobutanoate/2-iminopropanoate deaminase
MTVADEMTDPDAKPRFAHFKGVLDAAGADFSGVLKVMSFSRRATPDQINPIRQEFFGNARPASTLIGVKELALPGLLVDIETVVGLGKPL